MSIENLIRFFFEQECSTWVWLICGRYYEGDSRMEIIVWHLNRGQALGWNVGD
jgi:hypothetical protein